MFATTIIHFSDAYASIASHVYREATGFFPIVIGVLVVGGIAGLVGVAIWSRALSVKGHILEKPPADE